MAKVTPKAPETPVLPLRPVGPAKPVSAPAGPATEAPVTAKAPASGFQTGTPGLQGKFAYAPSIRTAAFAGSPGHKIGLSRPSEVLGPNKMTVGDLLVRIEEHLNDPKSLTAHDLALLNGAISVVS